MNEIGKEIDRELEEKELKAEAQTRRGLEIVEMGNYKFVATKRGAEFLNRVKEGFDLVDEWDKKKQECQRIELEKAQKKEAEKDEKVKFSLKIEVFDQTEVIPFETTRRGLEEFKQLLDPNKDEREYNQGVERETLTFYDGIVLVREIFHRIIDECFDSDDKDRFGFEYAPYLYDRMEDILENNVLNHVRDHRAEHLHSLFEIKYCIKPKKKSLDRKN